MSIVVLDAGSYMIGEIGFDSNADLSESGPPLCIPIQYRAYCQHDRPALADQCASTQHWREQDWSRAGLGVVVRDERDRVG